jgi:hypothetical protein
MMDSLYLWMAFDTVLTDAKRLWALLDEIDSAGLGLSRLDDVEPVRKAFSEATVKELFTPGVTPELPCRSLIGRGKRITLGVRACMPDEQGQPSVNTVGITLDRPKAGDLSLLRGFFDGDFFGRHRVAYAFVDTRSERFRQHVAGGINDRLPGIFWLNWLSGRYVEAIGEGVLLSLPWYRTAHLQEGLACWLYEDLNDPPADRVQRIHDVKTGLGEEKFVDGGWPNIPQLAVSGACGPGASPSPPVSRSAEDDLTAQMQSDAEICQRNANSTGFALDGTLDSLPSLEDLIDSLTPWSQASEDLKGAMVAVIGAYFGELIRNAFGGSWLIDDTYQTPALQITATLRIFPQSRVQKRWEEGRERSMVSFVDWLTTRCDDEGSFHDLAPSPD